MLVNFREYILKIALTRSIFQPKMHQHSQTHSWIKGSVVLMTGWEESEERGWRGEREGKVRVDEDWPLLCIL